MILERCWDKFLWRAWKHSGAGECPGDSQRAIDFSDFTLPRNPCSTLVCGPFNRQFPAVDLSNFMKIDPYLLVGLLNTELRNHCDSLEDLVKTHDLQYEAVIAKMTSIDYIYRPEQNQFR